jgi:hypothetical protein
VELAHAAGLTQVELGDYRDRFNGSEVNAVTATDFFEHLTRPEIFDALGRVHAVLRAHGVLILRVPNAVSPFGGNYRYGDITHETSFTASSLRQLGAATGFESVTVHDCTPPVHGIKSLARSAVWKAASGAMKITLAAETGVLRGHLVTQNIVAVMRKGGQGSERNSAQNASGIADVGTSVPAVDHSSADRDASRLVDQDE